MIDGWLELSQLTKTNLRISLLAEEVDYVNRNPERKTDNSLSDDDYQLTTDNLTLRAGEPVSKLRSDILKYYSQEPETVLIGYGKNGRTLGVEIPDPAVSIYISDGLNNNLDEEVISQIDILSDKYKTHRGIKIGDPVFLMFERYGLHDSFGADDNSESFIYQHSNMSLIFETDKEKKITRITYLLTSPGAENCVVNPATWSAASLTQPALKEVIFGGRAWFYSQPDEQCKTDRFIIRGDRVLQYRRQGDFAYVNYINSKKKVAEGWIKLSLLEKADEQNNTLNYEDFIWSSDNGEADFLGKPLSDNIVSRWLDQQKENISVPPLHDFFREFELWHFDTGDTIVTVAGTNVIIEKRTGEPDKYISGITFKNNRYKTRRGIAAGDTYQDMVKAYGNVYQISPDDNCYYYSWFDRQLGFCFGENRVITEIMYKNYPESDRR
ncbi:hypothetical protein CKG00_00950 [Morganella morganii]|uniref:Uncharacterized protein n=1 Tax=Morganella morganii TaxID=582 RepID=A0A433ZSM2_MORMO|nr:hypothetical protein [Morganella morganii]RUT65130.1 hypothetical protein CKG00_00950 [Morganella morganii]